MANRFPLIIDSSALQIKEIPANDNLDLANNNIVNVVDINASGVVTATSFSGSGVGLTNLPSAQLTGALPAIDGSALTGVISGIGIKTEGGNVGFGVTILDFRGSGVSTITAPVSGISTINIIGSSGNIVGIDTLGISYFNNLNISGVTTIGAGTSTIGVEVPTVTLSNNNPTIVGTSGTTGEIKQIGGAPFYYDGSAWREFVLSDGTPVTTPADTDWDSVIFRNDFDTSTDDQKFSEAAGLFNGISLVTSPVKVGTKSLRIQQPNGYLGYDKRSEYDFTGAWTIEGWFYLDTMPAGTGTNGSALFSHTDASGYGTKSWGLNLELAGGNGSFVWYNNSNTSYNYNNDGVGVGTITTSTISDNWAHIALVREPSNGSLHLYVNGTESSETSSDQVIDNDIPAFEDSYKFIFGFIRFNSSNSASFDGFFDDVRISTIARYTSNFTPPTSALPISGTSGTVYSPPGSKQGEIALGNSPTWTGTTGVTASRVASGQYRLTFSSPYGSATAYTVNANAMDYDPATSIVGVGVSRVSSSVCDFYVRKLSDSSAVDTGSLAVNVYKK